ncbi:16S rRNA (cytidine(1402)-2'-O)-methyltransferase [Athalassotoga saccharophila]|uniref:16S rRNA (cytidine(1402)-2'-O)-methyltransferase n=1 Tax=Athalassotoga saccharophila TaxID=1441386 RepID=UPI001379C8A0|nr:16S rRNA (cytidine(1402)-2'-O)-methyltransferase [Athalassotoga saccharophila]BBJ27156.1 ribosomal RNA small subunit methyltransferase I [Athalassotoga saccharophila]
MGLKIVATPIGNLSDISYRALETLKSVDAILCEDTRRTMKLITHFEISKALISFNDNNASKKIPYLLEEMKKGTNYALVSDAGMPVISDPGMKLVNECHENGIEVDVIPGPSAVVSAVAASGLNASHFVFLGFLPRGSKLRKILREMFDIGIPVVFFESPYRINDTLKEICTLSPHSRVFVAREMTKINQTFYRGTPCELCEKVDPVGEITVVLEWGKES